MPPDPAAPTPHRHPIGVVARRTGLKPDLIRAWERRYGAIEPTRSPTRRRFYSDADVERLILLRRAVGTGRGISQVAGLPNDSLEALIAREAPPQVPLRGPAASPPPAPGSADETAARFLASAVAAAQGLDGVSLEMILEQASLFLSRKNLLEKLLAPLLTRIGELWHEGALRPAHEHLTSTVVRSFLGGMLSAYHPAPSAARLVVTTPARQHHELGAFLAAATAADEGWQATYLGPNLPPEEIAGAAVQCGARAIALSVTYPPDDPLFADDLRRIRRLVGPFVEILVGGRSAQAYQPAIDEVKAYRLEDLAMLRQMLTTIRSRPAASEPESPAP